ncbi:MAG: hypothetical protein L6V90_06420 [Treponema succinifaciens]|nr:MAG: hypothetical protein L6V90_06420 [Treponema succinifaciens]
MEFIFQKNRNRKISIQKIISIIQIFHREFTNKIKELLKNPEPEVILKSDWGLSILPILAFFKNNTLFDSLKLAYNQALRYN